MGPLSMDLRERIVKAHQEGQGSVRKLAKRFKVGSRTVSRYLAAMRDKGDLTPSPERGKPPAKIDQAVLRELWEATPDATEAELAEALRQRTGVQVHRATVGRTLLRMGLTRKKSPTRPPSRTPNKSRPSPKSSQASKSGA